MIEDNEELAGMDEATAAGQWFDEEEPEEVDSHIREYDITASPNDSNTLTLFNFIESGVVKIPAFQRNYVWDIKRASKLIESMIIGLPVPQIFLYEEARNNFQVIDGQQRLMSLYYFIQQRFPKKEKRIELRSIFDSRGRIPDEILQDDVYFSKFSLQLPEQLPKFPNRLNGLNYSTLGDLKTTFDLRTIRNIIIKQTSPPDDDSSIYEIFNRLNSGGMNLKPQEIRTSLYHSAFYDLLYRLNGELQWRRLLGVSEYATYFDWNNRTANTFFKLFGEVLGSSMKDEVKKSPQLKAGCDSFLELGYLRNCLVHQNFASFPFEKTAEEVYEEYKQASSFVDYVVTRLCDACERNDSGSGPLAQK